MATNKRSNSHLTLPDKLCAQMASVLWSRSSLTVARGANAAPAASGPWVRCVGTFPDSVDVLGPAEVSLLLPTPLWPDSEGESLLLCSAGGAGTG